tara:strand:- start:206 stop:1057 length:852 start_codon:yes stop_codon:yes gene_type:complete
MLKRNVVYEGRTKILYEGPNEGTLIQHFKDDMRWDIAKKKKAKKEEQPEKIFGKGVLNNRMSAYLMTQLDHIGVPTHFIKAMNMREQLVWDIDILPFEVVVRNIAAKDMSERLGVDEGAMLPRSIVEFQLKNEKKSYPVISDEHIIAFGWATQDELEDLYMMALRVNDFLTGLFLGIGLKLVDVHLEFGRIYYEGEGYMILGDEISPDNCRLWPLDEKRELKKEAISKDMNNDIQQYQEISSRLGLLPEGKITPDTKVVGDLLNHLKVANEGKRPIKPGPVKR